MGSNIIDPATLFTFQEHIILGSTFTSEIKDPSDVYKPQVVIRREMPIDVAEKARQKLNTYPLGFMHAVTGVENAVFKLEEIDLKTGETLKDPVVGILDKEKGFIEDEEATGKLYGALREVNIDLHLRESSVGIETEISGAENKA